MKSMLKWGSHCSRSAQLGGGGVRVTSQDVIDLEQMQLGLPVQRRRDVKASTLALTPEHHGLNLSSAPY